MLKRKCTPLPYDNICLGIFIQTCKMVMDFQNKPAKWSRISNKCAKWSSIFKTNTQNGHGLSNKPTKRFLIFQTERQTIVVVYAGQMWIASAYHGSSFDSRPFCFSRNSRSASRTCLKTVSNPGIKCHREGLDDRKIAAGRRNAKKGGGPYGKIKSKKQAQRFRTTQSQYCCFLPHQYKKRP